MVKCEICNKEFLRINSFHLKTHGILNELEYLKKYPIQLHNFKRDILKNDVAAKAGYNLKRIRA